MSHPWRFYEMMSYPIPRQKEIFAFQEVLSKPQEQLSDRWSRAEACSEQFQQYRQRIQRRQRLWKALPFVESVYLSNSITFNALHEGSNVDVFIIVSDDRLWHAKTRISLMLRLFRLGKTGQKQKMKLSANFIITQSAQDLSPLLLTPHDPYLVYRLAHLVPIYHRDFAFQDELYEKNKRLQYYLPNFPSQQSVFLGIDVEVGQFRTKKVIEAWSRTLVGNLVEHLLKVARR